MLSDLLSLCFQPPTIFFVGCIIVISIFSLSNIGRKTIGGHGASIATMIGILGTFWGVTVGFLHFNDADIQNSLPQLIMGLRSAFIASAVGVFCAIVIKIIQPFLNNNNASYQPSMESMAESIYAIRQGLIGDGDSTLISQITLMRTNLNDRLDKIALSQDNFLKEMAKSNSEALIDALKDVMRDFNTKINEQFGDNFKHLNEAVGRLLDWQSNYKDTLNILIEEEKASAANLKISAERLADITDKAEAFTVLSNELSSILSELRLYGKSMNDLTQSANTSISSMSQAVNSFEKSVSTALDGIATKIYEVTKSTNTSLENASKRIESQVKELDSSLEREITKALESMSRQFVSISEKFANDYIPLADKLREIVTVIERVKK